MNNKRQILFYAITGVLISGALYYFSTGLEGIRVLAWIAPLPILLLAPNLSRSSSIIASLSAYLLGGLNLVPYLSGLAPVIVIILSVIFPSTVFAVAIANFRSAVIRQYPIRAMLIPPSIWTIYEFALSSLSPHATAGSIAYSQSGFLPLIQIASVTGLWGISFLLVFIPSGLAALWHFRRERRQLISVGTVLLTVVVIVGSFGFMRLVKSRSYHTLRVGLAASDTTVRYFQTTKLDQTLSVVGSFLQEINTLAGQGAKVIVLPEKSVGMAEGCTDTVLQIFKHAAAIYNVFIVAGLNVIGEHLNQNIGVVISPQGNVLLRYHKVLLIPGLESEYIPGRTAGLFTADSISSGVLICKDMDSPVWVRRYGEHGARILFVPAWDFKVDAWLHSRMAVLRGVEVGAAVVRSAQEGFLTISDDKGRIISQNASWDSPMVRLVSECPVGSGKTFYDTAGNWFPWLNVIYLSFTVVASLIHRRKPTNA